MVGSRREIGETKSEWFEADVKLAKINGNSIVGAFNK